MPNKRPEPPNEATLRERKLVWERVKKTAQAHHDHPKDHGINMLIGEDAGRASQTVGDWKHGRIPIPASVMARLAAKYGVSARYLECLTDDPTQAHAPAQAMIRAKMVELVEDVVQQLDPNADPALVTELCGIALEMIQEGKAEETILGSLYKRMREAAASQPSPDR